MTSTAVRVTALVSAGAEHGVSRYARVLAGAMAAEGADVIVEDVSGRQTLARRIRGVLRARRGLVHLQFTRDYWGTGWRQVAWVVTLQVLLVGRPIVVTAHDFHTLHVPWPRRPRAVVRRLRGKHGWWEVAAWILLRRADLVVTCTEEERRHLGWTGPRRTAVIELYVEEPRVVAPAAGEGHHEPAPTLVVLGWVHRRKAQHVAVEVLTDLPGWRLVLAGAAAPRNHGYLSDVLALAAERGLGERVTCTGFLSDEDLDAVIGSATVALAPYERIAASASVSTLVAGGVPVVARASPALVGLAEACPTAVHLYAGDALPSVIAKAVLRTADEVRSVQRHELATWARGRSLPVTARRHLKAFALVAPPSIWKGRQR